jgi:L1 cell adhesion molecule like protein
MKREQFALNNPTPRGIIPIEATLDGIMNVSAQDKSIGNVKKIRIKEEKDQLS